MTDQTPEASAVEALAEVFRAALIDQYAVVIPEMDPEWAAEIVIASDWLATHAAAARADERERVLGEVEQALAGEDTVEWARRASTSMVSLAYAIELIDDLREQGGGR